MAWQLWSDCCAQSARNSSVSWQTQCSDLYCTGVLSVGGSTTQCLVSVKLKIPALTWTIVAHLSIESLCELRFRTWNAQFVQTYVMTMYSEISCVNISVHFRTVKLPYFQVCEMIQYPEILLFANLTWTVCACYVYPLRRYVHLCLCDIAGKDVYWSSQLTIYMKLRMYVLNLSSWIIVTSYVFAVCRFMCMCATVIVLVSVHTWYPN